MARIRSVHPGLFTDEAFMEMAGTSPVAGLAFVGLWTECDDYGVFDWKPLTLKARILPTANADMVGLLEQMREAGFVERFTVDGRLYGAVKNFCRFQRPKHPKASYPKPETICAFVGTASLSDAKDTDASPTDDDKASDECPTSVRHLPHKEMEDGGDKGKRKISERRALRSALIEIFETRVWAVYPRREGSNPKKPALEKFLRLADAGEDVEAICAGVAAYATARVGQDPRFTQQMTTFLNKHCWKDEHRPSRDGPYLVHPPKRKVDI